MKINEIFCSIQGEGPNVGQLTTFVRLGECNKRCTFCDTKYAQSNWIETSVQNVIDAIKRRNCRNVTFTGGEPALQLQDILEIITVLRPEGYWFGIETNGSIPFLSSLFDVVVVSPKDFMDIAYWMGQKVTFKFVVNTDNIMQVIDFINDNHIGAYLMPMGTLPDEILMNSILIAEKITSLRVNARLGMRAHILLGIR